MDTKTISRYTGFAIVYGTHIYMLNALMPEDMKKQHAYINLVGATLILYSLY
jgi:hypothetical protein